MSNIHEECGVFGVFSPDNYDVARMTYYGLFSLQHRRQGALWGAALADWTVK